MGRRDDSSEPKRRVVMRNTDPDGKFDETVVEGGHVVDYTESGSEHVIQSTGDQIIKE